MADIEIPKDAKKERQRSPNYPAVGLREAVERVRKLVETNGRAGAPPELAAKHIGYNSAHGQAMSVVAALKRFGLVAEVSGRLAPTQAAIEILNLPDADIRKQKALQGAALSPPLYRELVEAYKDTGLPNRDILEVELTTYKKFNPKAVGGLVSDFLDTLEYAKINVNDAIELKEAGTSTEAASMNTGIESVTGARTVTANSQPSTVDTGERWMWLLSKPRGVRAELRITGDFSKSDLGRLKRQIDILEESLEETEEAVN